MRISKSNFIIIATLIVAVTLGCQKSEQGNAVLTEDNPRAILKQLEWMVGAWQREIPRGPVIETWKMVNDTLWQGKAYRLAQKDTTMLETLSLQIIDDEIFYVPVLPHNPAPVYFKMNEQSGNSVAFENPDHDFPQRIIYDKISDDSLHARIEGANAGVETSVDFYFKRVEK